MGTRTNNGGFGVVGEKAEKEKRCSNRIWRKQLEEVGEEVKQANTTEVLSAYHSCISACESSWTCICSNFHGNTTIENNSGI